MSSTKRNRRDVNDDDDDIDNIKEDGEIMEQDIQLNNNQSNNTSNTNNNTSSNDTSRSRIDTTNQQKERKKNLFGSILGHLSKARKNLDKDKDVIEKQQQLKSKAEQRNTEMAERIAKMDKEKKSKEKMDLLIKKKDSIPINTQTWMNTHVETMKTSLVTSYLPSLLWSPRAHNETTNRLLDLRVPEIEKMIAKRLIDDRIRLENIDREIDNLNNKTNNNDTNNDDTNNDETKHNIESIDTTNESNEKNNNNDNNNKRQRIETKETFDGTVVDYDDE